MQSCLSPATLWLLSQGRACPLHARPPANLSVERCQEVVLSSLCSLFPGGHSQWDILTGALLRITQHKDRRINNSIKSKGDSS